MVYGRRRGAGDMLGGKGYWGGQVLVYSVVFIAGVVPRRWVFARIYVFTAWIWWMKILRGEAVSVCLYF